MAMVCAPFQCHVMSGRKYQVIVVCNCTCDILKTELTDTEIGSVLRRSAYTAQSWTTVFCCYGLEPLTELLSLPP